MGGLTLALAVSVLSGSASLGEGPGRASGTPEGRFQELREEYKAAEEEWGRRYNGEPGKADPGARYRDWPAWSFAPRFLALAEADPEDPVSFDILLRVLEFADHASEMDRSLLPSFERATAALLRDHIQDGRLKRACERMAGGVATPPREKFLRAVLETSRDREARAWACVGLARCLAARREAARAPEQKGAFAFITERIDPGYFAYIRATDPEDSYAEAKVLFERAIDEFGDIQLTGQRFKTVAAAARFFLNKLERDKLDRFAIGKPAPDVEGEDAEGVKFRLSDYRGKVVVLTFSGNWCGPCRAMYPHERALVEARKGKPFALLSVNTDEDRGTLKQAIEKGEITWRCWWEGGIDGPICSQWGIASFPDIYVIDPKGTIRHRFEGLPDPPTVLDEAVDALLGEMTTPAANP